MINLMKAEMMKLRKTLVFKLMIVFQIGIALMTALSSMSFSGSPELAKEWGMTLTGYDGFFSTLNDLPLMVFSGIILIGVFVCADFSNRTIQTEITVGHSRLAIVISKYLSILIGYAIVMSLYPVCVAVFKSLMGGFGQSITVGLLLHMLVVLGCIVLIGMAMISVGLLLAFVLQRTVLVMGASILITILGGNLLLSFAASTPAVAAVIYRLPLGFYRFLAIENYAPGALVQVALTCILCIALWMCITYAVFRKAELK